MGIKGPTIAELFPNLNADELKKAEEAFDRYLSLVLSIFERLEAQTNPQGSKLTY